MPHSVNNMSTKRASPSKIEEPARFAADMHTFINFVTSSIYNISEILPAFLQRNDKSFLLKKCSAFHPVYGYHKYPDRSR